MCKVRSRLGFSSGVESWLREEVSSSSFLRAFSLYCQAALHTGGTHRHCMWVFEV